MEQIKMKLLQSLLVEQADRMRVQFDDPSGTAWEVSMSFEEAEALRALLEGMFRRLEQAQKSHLHLFDLSDS